MNILQMKNVVYLYTSVLLQTTVFEIVPDAVLKVFINFCFYMFQ